MVVLIVYTFIKIKLETPYLGLIFLMLGRVNAFTVSVWFKFATTGHISLFTLDQSSSNWMDDVFWDINRMQRLGY